MPDQPEILADRGKALEDQFFRKEDQRLIQKLRAMKETEATREALAKASGIKDEAVLQKLVDLGVHAETVAALSVVPLVEVAWADGSLDAKEKRAILDGAAKSGVAPGSTGYELLERWLEHRPERRLLTAWTHLVRGLCDQMAPGEAAALKSALVDSARAVAVASGGFLGLGSKISPAEENLLRQLESPFGPARGA
jgi:hypothetical protein